MAITFITSAEGLRDVVIDYLEIASDRWLSYSITVSTIKKNK